MSSCSFGLFCFAVHQAFQFFETRLQVPDLGVFFGELLIQALDGRQGYATLVHDGNVFVITSIQAERRVEILRHGPDMFYIIGIYFVPPFSERHRRYFTEHFARIDGRKIFLQVAVATRLHGARGRKDVAHQIRGGLAGTNANDIGVIRKAGVTDINVGAARGNGLSGQITQGDVV